jgi:hypothetical protein
MALHPLPRAIAIGIALSLTLIPTTRAFAQAGDEPGIIAEVVKRVAIDPTTYAPAILMHESMRLDWQSSQVFFQNGFHEQNRLFTVTGRNNDRPVDLFTGNAKIRTAALQTLQMSALNNATAAVIERLLIRRFPTRRKLVRTLGWIERSAFASYWSYRLTANHWRQWQANERLARQLGYK